MYRPILFTSCLLICTNISSAEPFRFIAMPDTQRYAENLKPPHPLALDPAGTYRFFTDQTEWIARNADRLKIRYVVHLGDIVQSADDISQWERAKAAMDILDKAGVPYGTVIGNHDLLQKRGRVYDAYLTYFGPKRFVDKPYFKGSSPGGTSNYQVIDHGKYSFLFLNLSYATPRDDVDWAHEVLKKHPGKIVIVSTHAYLWDAGVVAGRYGEEVGFSIMSNRLNRSGRIPGSMTSQEFYDTFISKHANILMVQCGHSGLDWYRTDGVNGAGRPVIEVLTNYQVLPNGGEGYLRIYEIDSEAGTLTARSYSPTYRRDRTSFENFLQMISLSFDLEAKAQEKLGASGALGGGLVRMAQSATLKRDVIPGIDVVGEHPDYAMHRDDYLKLYDQAFLGKIPATAGKPEDWEGFWMKAFAPDPQNPRDYGPNVRSPSFTIQIDLDDYVIPAGDQAKDATTP